MPERMLAGHRVNFRAAGSGPLVVCVHCSSSHSGQWKPLMDALQGRYRMIAPDLLGYGRSGPLPAEGAWHRHDAAIIAALLEEEGPAHLVGHSLGGVATLAAIRAGAAVRSAALIEPVAFHALIEAGHGEAGDDAPIHARLAKLVPGGRHAEAAREFVEYWSGAEAFDAMDTGTRAYVIDTIPRVLADFDGVHADAPSLEDAARIDLPVTLFRGSATRPAGRAISGLLARAIPGARLVDVEGAAHMAAVTHPQLINPLIAAHLDAQPR